MLGLRIPSLTTAVSIAFLAYMTHSLWDLAKMWVPPSCEIGVSTKECLKSRLEITPKLNLIFVMDRHPECRRNPQFVGAIQLSSVLEEESKIQIQVPMTDDLKQNGSNLYLGVYSASPHSGEYPSTITKDNWVAAVSKSEVAFYATPLVEYSIPEPETFNLLSGAQNEEKKNPKKDMDRPCSHLRSQITVNVMSDPIRFPRAEIPMEFYHIFRLGSLSKTVYLPIVYLNEINLRIKDLRLINKTDTNAKVDITYRPISYGKLRVFLHFTNAFESMKNLGFTKKDNDEIKGILTDTNIVLLGVTFVISAVHLVFDFLSFTNEISFWRNCKSMKGISNTTILWRAFSQFVIFLYLMNENTSLLVLIPSGISAIIEMWKVSKTFKIRISFSGIKFGEEDRSEDEKKTMDYDANAMKYLSYILYPIVIGGAIYSLIYTPHKSWYSWTIQSTANGVYAFGFIFMLPQLFVNYKLKSVAHLPWKAFMYKAFNTFIDDAFAFIITMPTAHRVACFRDDVVFLIYLYQRYLYPIDSNRIDSSAFMDDELPSDKKQS
uniref:Lipid scramblase CLPTM1L n=1 Tax=Lepeophtheirus salmonis TaxID=72036 RepID=A0A0K2V6R6_LEPSM